MRWDAEKYDSVRAPQIDAGKELIAMAKVKETDSILDIGCGTGKLTVALAQEASQGFVTGIDPSEEMLARARTLRSPFGNLLVMQMSAQAMQFRQDFDLVYSNSALQWIPEQEDVIMRSYAALKANGRIALQLPAKDFCWAMMENIYSAISALGLEKVYRKLGSPWRFPLKDEMAGFLRKAGFVKSDVFYRDYTLAFDSMNDVLEWGTSAGLRPFLAPLSKKKQERFKYAFAMGFENYRTQRGIEFGFRRLFVLAEKS
jgi:trans-aconitate methyltransferase